MAYLRRAVNVTEVHLRPVKREEVERASHIIVSVRDPTERVVSAFEWHRPGGDRTYGRCFHRKRDVERYGNSCADDELYRCAATADAFADLVASRNSTDRCARVAKAFLAPDAGAKLLGRPYTLCGSLGVAFNRWLPYWNRHAIKHRTLISHRRGSPTSAGAPYLGKTRSTGSRASSPGSSRRRRASATPARSRRGSRYIRGHVPDGAPPGPTRRPTAAGPPSWTRSRTSTAPARRSARQPAPGRAAARAGPGLRARVLVRRVRASGRNRRRARVRSKMVLSPGGRGRTTDPGHRGGSASARRDAPGREADAPPLCAENQPRAADLHAEAPWSRP